MIKAYPSDKDLWEDGDEYCWTTAEDGKGAQIPPDDS